MCVVVANTPPSPPMRRLSMCRPSACAAWHVPSIAPHFVCNTVHASCVVHVPCHVMLRVESQKLPVVHVPCQMSSAPCPLSCVIQHVLPMLSCETCRAPSAHISCPTTSARPCVCNRASLTTLALLQSYGTSPPWTPPKKKCRPTHRWTKANVCEGKPESRGGVGRGMVREWGPRKGGGGS